jgi:DNA gyrase/topoisomerase IV subunit A
MSDGLQTLEGKIEPIELEDEMRSSFIDYAMSVLTDRALPDVRDGLKPSQRRILVAMNDLGLAPNKQHRKCAKIAGDTSGNYHPHGEAVIYPTLLRHAHEGRDDALRGHERKGNLQKHRRWIKLASPQRRPRRVGDQVACDRCHRSNALRR